MNFILKIVEGPNRGAEIALVDGVAVTFGKTDGCDIVLADQTMPDEPLVVEASGDGVAVGGEPLEPFRVKTLGATSFAVGPSDAPWGELKWPEKAESREAAEESHEEARKPDAESKPAEPAPVAPAAAEDEKEPVKKRRGCLGCLIVLLLLLLLLAGLGWLFRDMLMDWKERAWPGVSSEQATAGAPVAQVRTLSSIAEKYGLSLSESSAGATLCGNLRTRRERLAATAEAYETQPGVALDLSDDESFRTAAEDALFTLTEGSLKVTAATNRVLSIAGAAHSPFSLKKTLEALNADLPKLRDVDVTGVVFGTPAVGDAAADETDERPLPGVVRRSSQKKGAVVMPVCGILTTPYPCLVLRDGRRVLEGAAFGGGVIEKIGVDEVVITNSTGRFAWKP